MRNDFIGLLRCIEAEKHVIYRNTKIRNVNVCQSTDNCHSFIAMAINRMFDPVKKPLLVEPIKYMISNQLFCITILGLQKKTMIAQSSKNFVEVT